MSNQHPESLDELLRRATSNDEAGKDASVSASEVEADYVLPENPYERQMLDAEPATESAPAVATAKSKGKRKGKKKVAIKDVPYSDEDDEKYELRNTLREIFEGTFLGGQWLRRNVWFILFVTFLALIYVGNGYKVSHERIEQQRLQDTLEDRRLRELTLSSELTRKTRISSVEEVLTDTALTLPNDNVYTLPVIEDAE